MSQTAAPAPADDIAFVLALPPERQAAVLSALLAERAGRQPKPGAAFPVATPDGHTLGRFVPDAERMASEVALRGLSAEDRAWFLRPHPDDLDPDDSYTFEDLAALRAARAVEPRQSERATPGGVSTATCGR